MTLTIKRSHFLKMLTYAGMAIPSRSAEVYQSNYLITVRADGVSVVASNDDMACKVDQSMKDEEGNDIILNAEPGSFQTPAKYLLDIVSKLGSDVVTLKMVDTNLLNISDDSTEFNLSTRASDAYPDVDLTIPEDGQTLVVPLKDLKRLYDTTSYAVSPKGAKELYMGINIKASNGVLSFTATDTYRLAIYSIPEKNTEVEFNFTCPIKALDMITRAEDGGECTIYFDGNRTLFSTGSIVLYSRLLRGEFPSLERLIPSRFLYKLTCDTEEFLAAADRVKIISSAEDKKSQVKLTISRQNGAVLSARSVNYGNSQSVLRKSSFEMPEDQDIFEIGFNIDFAIEAVKALKSDKFTFNFDNPTRTFMVKNEDPENIQIITPIRMSSYY